MMTVRKYVLLGLTALSFATAPVSVVWAQTQDISASHLAAARGAITAIQATDRFDEILPGVSLAIKQQLIENNPDLEAQINDVVDSETIALVARRVDLENEAAGAYAKAISEADLKAIAAFYQTEAGKALLANGAIVSREIQTAAGVWQRGIERDLLENVTVKLGEVAPRNSTDAVEGAPAAPAQ